MVLAQGNQGACSEQGRCFLSEGLCEIPTTANPAGEQPLGAGLLQDPLGIPRLLSEVLRTRTRGAGHNLEHRRLLLNTRKHICAMQVTEPWHRMCRDVGESSPWRPSKLPLAQAKILAPHGVGALCTNSNFCLWVLCFGFFLIAPWLVLIVKL